MPETPEPVKCTCSSPVGPALVDDACPVHGFLKTSGEAHDRELIQDIVGAKRIAHIESLKRFIDAAQPPSHPEPCKQRSLALFDEHCWHSCKVKQYWDSRVELDGWLDEQERTKPRND